MARSLKAGIALLLMLGLVLSACSSNKSTNKEATDSKASPSASASSGTPASSAANEEPYKFTLVLSNENSDYVRQMQADDPYITALNKISAEEIGVVVDFQPFEMADRYVTLATRLASNDMPDVFQLDTTIQVPELAGAIAGGAILDTTELLNQFGKDILAAYPDDFWKSPNISQNGKLYGVPKLQISQQPKGIYIRQDWLDKLGMKQPETLDDYLAYFEAVKTTDLDGDGQHNEVPLVLTKELSIYNWVFEGYFGVFPDQWKYVDGTAQPDLIDPKMKEVIGFYKTLYDKGYINDSMFTMSMGERGGFILNNPVGAFVHDVQHSGKLGYYGNPGNYTTQQGVDIAVVTGPKTPEGTKRFAPLRLPNQNVFIISSKAKDPQKIVEYFNWYFSNSEALANLLLYGVEGHNYTVKDGKIDWDPLAKVNLDERFIYQSYISPMKGDLRASDASLAFDPSGDMVKQAKKDTLAAGDDRGAFKYMPVMKTQLENPQLGYGDGSLYADMFAKVILGRETLDQAFDQFVANWKKQGGNDVIAEATAWYNANK